VTTVAQLFSGSTKFIKRRDYFLSEKTKKKKTVLKHAQIAYCLIRIKSHLVPPIITNKLPISLVCITGVRFMKGTFYAPK